MEREKGFESQIFPVFSSTYDTAQSDERGSTEPVDASRHVTTAPEEGDDREATSALPLPTAELFITAGATLAERAARGRVERSKVEEILRRAVDQASALRDEAA